MSDEQREILRMVADKVISVEEGERLLRAIEQGSRRSSESHTDPRGKGSIHSVLDSVGAVMSSIGPIVSDAVGEAVSGISDLDLPFASEYDSDLDEVILENGTVSIEPGTKLTIKSKRANRSGGDVILEAVDDDSCSVWCEEEDGLTVRKKGNRASIRWTTGLLKIRVPKTVSELNVSTLGGDISAGNLDCSSVLKTMGGNLRLSGISGEFTAKTMGGSVSIAVSPEMRGESKAVTMGGGIDVSLPRNASLTIQAVTMGGSITVKETLDARIEGSTVGQQKASIRIGEESPTGSLSVKTMGGTIAVRDLHDE